MQQQDEGSVSAQVPVDEGESQLHEHRRYKREEESESLPDLVSSGAVRGAEVERCRGLGREQRHRHKNGTGESHPHSLRHLGNAARCFAQGPHIHHVNATPSVTCWKETVLCRKHAAAAAAARLILEASSRGWADRSAKCQYRYEVLFTKNTPAPLPFYADFAHVNALKLGSLSLLRVCNITSPLQNR